MEEKTTNIKERVLQIAEIKGVAKENFFERIGSSYGNFKGKSKNTSLSSDVLAEISAIYPDVNIEWIITGNGQAIKQAEMSSISSEPSLEYAPIGRFPKKRRPGELIKFYEVDFAAGDIEFYDDETSIKPAYTMDIPEFAGCTAFRTYSDSMEPLIKSGDILFSTKVDDWTDGLEYGQIYGITRNDNRRHLKYIRKARDGKSETHFLLKSENTGKYDDFHLAKAKIKSVWLIHGWINKRT